MTKGDHPLPESLKVIGNQLLMNDSDNVHFSLKQDYFTVDRNGKPVRDDIDPEALKLLELVHTGHEDDDFITIKPKH